MTTEKKKRVPKPQMIEATRWLVEQALPVFDRYPLDLDSEGKTKPHFYATKKNRHGESIPVPVRPNKGPGELFEEVPIDPNVVLADAKRLFPEWEAFFRPDDLIPLVLSSAIRWGVGFTRYIFGLLCLDQKKRQELINKGIRLFSKDPLPEAQALMDKYYPRKFCIYYTGERNIIRRQNSFLLEITNLSSQNIGDLCRAVISVNVLSSVDNDTGENALSFAWMCPRCGKVFEKKRGDQEYCSRTCLEAMAKRNQRKKTSTY